MDGIKGFRVGRDLSFTINGRMIGKPLEDPEEEKDGKEEERPEENS